MSIEFVLLLVMVGIGAVYYAATRDTHHKK